MAAPAARVRGLDELVRDFRRLSGELRREVQSELADVARPVAEEARGRAGALGLSSQTVAGIRHRVRGGRAFVEQRRGTVTGRRRDHGVRLMRRVLIPVLHENVDRVVRGLERMLDRLAGRHGF